MKKNFWAIFILGLCSSSVHSAVNDTPIIFPSEKEFQASLKFEIKRNAGMFEYSYSVANDVKSFQSIESIRIEHSDRTQDKSKVQGPPVWDAENGIDIEGTNFSLWWAAPHPNTTIEEYDRFPPASAVRPGQMISGFILGNRAGPPRIVDVYMKGWVPTPKLDEANDRFIVGDKIIENADSYADAMFEGTLPNQDERENSVKIITLGPSQPPSDPSNLCDTFILDLIGQVREAAVLGWIKHDLRKDRDDDDDHGKRKGDEKGKKKGHEKDDDEGDDNGDDDEMDDADKNLPGVAKSIIKKLTKVRRECLRGKFGSAREKLRALIKQVNAQRGKHLTEEAYALIKFNAEFLLEKI